MNRGSPEAARTRRELAERLRGLRGEIEGAALAHINALPEARQPQPPEYLAGVRGSVAAGLDYVIGGVEGVDEGVDSVPVAVRAQAKRSAQAGIPLETVLRRYAAGDRLLAQVIMAEADSFPVDHLRGVLSAIAPRIDLMMATVAAEYTQEMQRMRRSPDQRLAERVQLLLSDPGEVDGWDLDYDLDTWHVGMILAGSASELAGKTLAGGLGRKSLVVPRDDGFAWVWLGGRVRPSLEEVEDILGSSATFGVSIAVGEPRFGIKGWRLTHREAQAAFEVMLHRPTRLLRSADALILAALLRDEPLAESLVETFVAPLDEQGDSGEALRATLRAYLQSGFNAATAAAALQVNRHTVKRRISKIEEALGRLIPSCHAELEIALRLEELLGESRRRRERNAA